MSFPSLSGDDLRAWLNSTSGAWRRLIAEYPEILNFPCDIRETKSVGELLQHVVAVELRYAQRLHGVPETPYEHVSYETGEAIYATHSQAMQLLDELDSRTDDYWQEQIQITTRSGGSLQVQRSAIFVHLQTHSIRHYAQLATLVRQHGFTLDQSLDYLITKAAP